MSSRGAMQIIVFFAHPDDETILAGGVLALLSASGARLHYVCATRGEGGELGEPPLCTREQLGVVREAELVNAVNALKGSSLTFLGYTDPLVGEDGQVYAYSENLTFVAGQLASSIRQFHAGAVITHGSDGEYGHPAHIFTHRAALAAVASFGDAALLLYSVAASFPQHPRPRLANQSDPAHLVLDISPVLERKIEAAMCHRTQHALFVRRASEEAGRPISVAEVIMPLESLHRHYPRVESAPEDELAQLLKPYLWNPQTSNSP